MQALLLVATIVMLVVAVVSRRTPTSRLLFIAAFAFGLAAFSTSAIDWATAEPDRTPLLLLFPAALVALAFYVRLDRRGKGD